MSKTTVLLRSLKRLLEPEFEVVAMCDNTVSLTDALDQLEPDATVIDLDPDLDHFVVHLVNRRTASRLVALTDEPRPDRIRTLEEAGVGGVVRKLHVAEELPAALRAVLRGETYLAPPDTGSEGVSP